MGDTEYVAERPPVWTVYRLRLADTATNDPGEHVKINGRALAPGDYVLSNPAGEQRGHTKEELEKLYVPVSAEAVQDVFPDPKRVAAAELAQALAQKRSELAALEAQGAQA